LERKGRGGRAGGGCEGRGARVCGAAKGELKKRGGCAAVGVVDGDGVCHERTEEDHASRVTE
jgi:hypothetical protein